MSESTPDTPENPARPPAPAARAWRQHPATWIAAGVALLALWQWYDARTSTRSFEQQLARRLAEGETQSKESRVAAEQAREAVRDMQVRLGVIENRLAESQNQQVALEALYQELSRSRDESVLADVEQTLLVAGQQLQLAGNVQAALIALSAADNRLARLDRPQLAALRKVLARDIERLKQAPYVDTTALSTRLDGLLAGVDVWPLAMTARPRDATARKAAESPGQQGWRGALAEFWGELKSLVRIETLEGNDAPLLAPEQAFFLRENLRLRLISARIGLLAHDDRSFKSDVRAARDWLARYFDTRNPQVAAAAVQLKQLQDSTVTIEMPSIEQSLDAVRSYRLTRDKR
jgi:uroporphyrin-3 C-methyltransferase